MTESKISDTSDTRTNCSASTESNASKSGTDHDIKNDGNKSSDTKKLEQKKSGKKSKKIWHVRSSSFNSAELADLLTNNWKPFSASVKTVFVRKKF